ncbi:MAG: FHA domain-containing protein [bacterium]
MICGFCKSNIEADSSFCDQCGAELLICEKCGKSGKGKRCIEDGGKLITVKEKNQLQQKAQQNINTQNPVVQINNFSNMQQPAIRQPQQVNPQQYNNQQPNVGQPYVNTNANARLNDNTVINTNPTISSMNVHTIANANGSTKTDIPQLVLINKAINATLTINENDIVGRKAGPFIHIFGNYSQISGQHAQFTFNPVSGWCVKDLGSSNGTKYMGAQLYVGVPQPIQNKCFLVFANIEFYIQITETQAKPIQNNNAFDLDKTVRL